MITAFGHFAPVDTLAPSQPGSIYLVSDPSTTNASLSWGASSDNIGVTGYEIYRNNSPAGTSTTNSKTVTFLPTGGENTFKVRSYDAAGNFSSFAQKLVYANPNASTISYVNSTESSINISFPAHVTNGGIDRAEIFVDGSLHKTETSFSDATTSSNVGQLNSGTQYSIKMRIFNNSDYSVRGAFSNTITASTSPGAPTT